jgi:hypothetical protein
MSGLQSKTPGALPPAVRFGEKRRFDSHKAIPMFYGFVPYPFGTMLVNDATGVTEQTSANLEGPDGLAIASGQFREIPIVMSRDSNFHLCYIKYGAFLADADGGAVGSRHRLVAPADLHTGDITQFVAQGNQLIPRWTELDVSVYMTSSGGRDLYGGFGRHPLTNFMEEQPVPAMTLQSDADGMGMIRTAFQLPKEASVRVRILNQSDVTLNVYGFLFGYKIVV